jgi:transcriptional regulator with XRE-family HTH domain
VPKSTPPSEIFRKRLLQAREMRQLTQAELAAKAGLPPAAISHFETGGRKPSFENLVKLAEALSVTTDFLLGREPEPEAAGEEIAALFRDLGKASAADQEFIRDLLATRKKKRGP